VQSADIERVVATVSPERLLKLEQAAVRIASPTFHESELADYFADYLRDLGLDVELMEVTHPSQPGMVTRQCIARLKGEGGPTLMINGHMDPVVSMTGWTVDPLGAKFEDGWIWGAGAHDDKGGLAAAISAIEAIVRSGTKLKGDILLCAVACHKAGGLGTKALINKGIRADMCINMEHSAGTIATTVVGQMRSTLVFRGNGLFFRYSKEAKEAYFNPLEQMALMIDRLGHSLDPHGPGSWLTFTPHPDLPGFPMHRFDGVSKSHYGREVTMTMQVRTVPGMTPQSINADLEKVIAELKAEHPNFDCMVEMSFDAEEDTHLVHPHEIAKDHPLTVALAEGLRRVSNREPELGGALRIGNTGDGNFLAAAGIPTLQYGPGDIRIYQEWPAPDERVELRELVEVAKAIAFAACRVCG
jgi:acetylornithine deacetylase